MQKMTINFLWAKSNSAVETLYYGEHETHLGNVVIAATDHGLSAVDFADNKKKDPAAKRLMKTWPKAQLVENAAATETYAAQLFKPPLTEDATIAVHIFGSDFQQDVWQELTNIPFGELVNYQTIAEQLENPSAARAVGSAIAANPVAFFIPCHRVVRADGEYGDYRWGKKLKKQLIDWERETVNAVGTTD